jgi:hypothetical protein
MMDPWDHSQSTRRRPGLECDGTIVVSRNSQSVFYCTRRQLHYLTKLTVAGQRGIFTRLRCVPMLLLNDARGVEYSIIITELKERANSFSGARPPRI